MHAVYFILVLERDDFNLNADKQSHTFVRQCIVHSNCDLVWIPYSFASLWLFKFRLSAKVFTVTKATGCKTYTVQNNCITTVLMLSVPYDISVLDSLLL